MLAAAASGGHVALLSREVRLKGSPEAVAVYGSDAARGLSP
jgi:hypothetical protein